MKLSLSCIALGLALAALAAPLNAQSLSGATTASTNGSWSVMRLADNNCVGVLKRNNDIRVTPTALKVPVRGLIQTITLRFEDKAARAPRAPSANETELNAVLLTGGEFAEALQSGRVRVQVQTFGRGVVVEDVELSGAQAAVEGLKSSCPVAAVATASVAAPGATPGAAPTGAVAAPVAGAAAVAAPVGAAAATAAGGAIAAAGTAAAPTTAAAAAAVPAAKPEPAGSGQCPAIVVERMRAAGLRETQVFIICR